MEKKARDLLKYKTRQVLSSAKVVVTVPVPVKHKTLVTTVFV